MDSGDRLRRRKSLQERLGLVCCGSTTWGIEQSTIDADDHDDGNGDDLDDPVEQLPEVIQTLPESNSDPDCVFPSPRMNLAAALAAERQSRSTDVVGESLTLDNENESSLTIGHRDTTPATPARMSLMKLLEEATTEEQVEGVGMMRDDVACCVCMGRKKGAAFIPCGHTFCRVCSRELWLNRGSCPLCNRSILEILDIF